MSAHLRAAAVVREARARLVPMVLSIPARIAQLRQVRADDNEPEPEPGAQPKKRKRLVRNTVLLAAQSLRAPIIDRKD